MERKKISREKMVQPHKHTHTHKHTERESCIHTHACVYICTYTHPRIMSATVYRRTLCIHTHVPHERK